MRFTWARAAVASVALVLTSIVGAGGAQAAQPAPARPLAGTALVSPAAASPGVVLPEAAVLPAAGVARPLPGDPEDVVPPADDAVDGVSPAPVPVPVPTPSPSQTTPPQPPPTEPRSLVGYDVSWPQCGEPLPDAPAFAIVGVTGGLATTTNPCLAEQLAWAETSTGGTAQPRVALYVNTANPGHDGVWWPSSDSYAGEAVVNPYGTCVGEADAACAYVYGWAKAHDAVQFRGVSDPAAYLWWLDVETENTWRGGREANRAVLEGMTAYIEGIGARVGLYSTGYQWWRIVGSVPPSSNLYRLPSWLAGATTLEGARANCSKTPLTAGGTVTMTQYVRDGLDHNHSCE